MSANANGYSIREKAMSLARHVKNVESSSSFPIQLCICTQKKKIISNYVSVYGNLVRAEEK